MNFLYQDFQKLSSERQTNTTESIYHVTSLVSMTVKSSQMNGQMK